MLRPSDSIALPEPRIGGEAVLERALAERRSIREFGKAPLTQAEVSQLLWAGQGITSRDGRRTAPSAGAFYPLGLYLVAGNVQGLEAGVYKYVPEGHRLKRIAPGDARRELSIAALEQECVERGAAVLVFAAAAKRTLAKYGPRGVQYVHIEVGHAAQNVALQATALGLGAVTIGAFDDAEVRRVVRLADNEAPFYLMPLGRL
jgi:SagB-type dehydrogenase family enzyme